MLPAGARSANLPRRTAASRQQGADTQEVSAPSRAPVTLRLCAPIATRSPSAYAQHACHSHAARADQPLPDASTARAYRPCLRFRAPARASAQGAPVLHSAWRTSQRQQGHAVYCCPCRVTVKSLTANTNVPLLAKEIVEKCKLIHPSKVQTAHSHSTIQALRSSLSCWPSRAA